MSERRNSSADGAPGPGDRRNEGQARFLFFSGWVITLCYLPSGLLHFLLGSGVYFRDGLLLLHLTGCLVWLARNREFSTLTRRLWTLCVPALFVLPAFADGGSRVEALTFVKWTALWVDWIILGRMAGFVPGITPLVKTLIGITAALLLADLGAGLYERINHTFLIAGESNDQTAFGVQIEREATLGEQLRVKGLQRDVFSFANLMGMSTVLGLLLFTNLKRPALRLPALAWTVAFGAMLLASGGRSAFFGVLASGLLVAGLLLAPQWVRRHYPRVVLGWLLACLVISAFGIGRLTESVGGSVMSSSGVGNSVSAYMRDSSWADILDAIGRVPVVLIFGSPFSALIDPKVDVFYHWADNEYLWLLYHASVLGFVAMAWFFSSVLLARAEDEPERGWAMDATVLFLLFVMGEAVARESMTFIGAMPLFVAIGFLQAGRAAAKAPAVEAKEASGPPRRRVANPANYELTRRIQAKMKEKQ